MKKIYVLVDLVNGAVDDTAFELSPCWRAERLYRFVSGTAEWGRDYRLLCEGGEYRIERPLGFRADGDQPVPVREQHGGRAHHMRDPVRPDDDSPVVHVFHDFDVAEPRVFQHGEVVVAHRGPSAHPHATDEDLRQGQGVHEHGARASGEQESGSGAVVLVVRVQVSDQDGGVEDDHAGQSARRSSKWFGVKASG